jgi:hypothetical protein
MFASLSKAEIMTLQCYRSIAGKAAQHFEPSRRRKAKSPIRGLGFLLESWWPGAESNHRHADFQLGKLVNLINKLARQHSPTIANNVRLCHF